MVKSSEDINVRKTHLISYLEEKEETFLSEVIIVGLFLKCE